MLVKTTVSYPQKGIINLTLGGRGREKGGSGKEKGLVQTQWYIMILKPST